MTQNPNLFLSVGKPIKDEYGRVIGKVASFALTPSGKFDTVYIEKGDGKFTKSSVEHLKFDGTDVTLISKLRSDVNTLCDQIPLLWRKDQALKDLSEKKKISKELYDELHGTFDGALNQLKSEAQALSGEIDKEIVKCAEELKQLNYALVHLELEHEIGQVNDEYYNTAFTMIQESLKQVHEEKNDLDQIKSNLSNILLGDTPKITELDATKIREASKGFSSISTTPDLPEPPVVVYVKEIGKAGI